LGILGQLPSEVMYTALLIFVCSFSISSILLTYILKHAYHDFKIINQATSIKKLRKLDSLYKNSQFNPTELERMNISPLHHSQDYQPPPPALLLL
jgi:hypothetical protein